MMSGICIVMFHGMSWSSTEWWVTLFKRLVAYCLKIIID
jgi:hypothetical protein